MSDTEVAKDVENAPTTVVPKYSRYRSVRRANAEATTPPAVDSKQNGEPLARSMSRYRRSRATPQTDFAHGPSVPAVPQLPRQYHSQSVGAGSQPANVNKEPVRRVTNPVTSAHHHNTHTGYLDQRRQLETEVERYKRKAWEAQIQDEEQRRIVEREHVAREDADEEAARILAEQKRKDLERLEAELDAATATKSPTLSPLEKFGLFSRMGTTKSAPSRSRGQSQERNTTGAPARQRTQKITTKIIGAPQPLVSVQSFEQEPPQVKYDQIPPEPPKTEAPPKNEVVNAIVQGGGGIVPQTDAPISASNAGERRVQIRCKQSSITLPITPETTPLDLIRSAANIMTQDISISHSLLLESYNQMGLERRLRRYEHVRDVMNSWDGDSANEFVIQKSDSPQSDHDLDFAHVPKVAPKDLTVYMYHSQRPGKWNKRYITLLSMGQIFISKKPDSKVTDKDVQNICHLSDFDIYTATPRQLRKVYKPPKKNCYAIKSQQKATMFLNTENFVHFFCTNDNELAQKWYDTVQQWRSWYLVHRLGEGKEAPVKTTKNLTGDRSNGRSGHALQVSVDKSPYTIGTFQPLLDPQRFGSPANIPISNDDDSEEENRPRQIPFHLRNSGSMPAKETRRHPPIVNYKLPPESDKEEEFASGGLLGRSYTQRRQQKESEDASRKNRLSAEVPTLMHRGSVKGLGHTRSVSARSNKDREARPETSGSAGGGGGGLQRSSSQRQKPKPLLDFTPTFREAPQWDKTGKGHGVKATEGVPLVEVATGPDGSAGLNTGAPPTMLFRRDQNPDVNPARPSTAGKKDASGAFVKGGLVSGM